MVTCRELFHQFPGSGLRRSQRGRFLIIVWRCGHAEFLMDGALPVGTVSRTSVCNVLILQLFPAGQKFDFDSSLSRSEMALYPAKVLNHGFLYLCYTACIPPHSRRQPCQIQIL